MVTPPSPSPPLPPTHAPPRTPSASFLDTLPLPPACLCVGLPPPVPTPHYHHHTIRYKAKKKAFTKYVAKYADGKKAIEAELAQMKKHCTTIRVLAHTQVCARGWGGGVFWGMRAFPGGAHVWRRGPKGRGLTWCGCAATLHQPTQDACCTRSAPFSSVARSLLPVYCPPCLSAPCPSAASPPPLLLSAGAQAEWPGSEEGPPD